MVKGRALARPSERSERFEPIVMFLDQYRILDNAGQLTPNAACMRQRTAPANLGNYLSNPLMLCLGKCLCWRT